MAWVKIKPDDIGPYLYGPQRRFLENLPDEDGGGPFVETLIKDLVAWIRAEIRTSKQPVSVRRDTVPASLKGIVCWLVIEVLLVRFPPLHLTPDQKTQIREARALLGRLAEGKFTTEVPSDPEGPDAEAQERPHGFSFLHWRIRDATGRHMRGL